MMHKVLIGVPCLDSIKTKTAFSLFNLKRGGNTELIMKVGADVARNRNQIVEYAIEKGFTHILFIDSDMKFNPDTLERLLENDEDICGVMYHQRALPLRYNLMPMEQDEERGKYEIVDFKVPADLFEVKWVGTGIMLIKTEVFKKLQKPYFAFLYEDEYVGEDVYFCRKARDAGYKIFVDATVQNRHVGNFEY